MSVNYEIINKLEDNLPTKLVVYLQKECFRFDYLPYLTHEETEKMQSNEYMMVLAYFRMIQVKKIIQKVNDYENFFEIIPEKKEESEIELLSCSNEELEDYLYNLNEMLVYELE